MGAELKLWEEPLYRLILQITVAQIFFLLLIIIGIALIRAIRILQRKRTEHISSDLYTPLMNFLAGDMPLEVTADVAKKYPRTNVCRELERYAIMLGGDALARIRALYEHLDLRNFGIKLSGSWLWWRRLEGMRLLGAAGGHDVVDVLLDGLNDRHAIVRLAAARSLGRIKHPKSIAPILTLMATAKQVSRRQLAQTLVSFGPAAYPSLRRLLQTDPEDKANSKTISTTLEMLALTGDIESAPAIRKMLTTSNFEVRIAAFKSAILLHIPLSSAALKAGLTDSEWPVRAQAAIAGGKIGDASIVEKLGACLGDGNWWVRNNAGHALSELGLPGIKKLEKIYRESDDAFARDMAARTLTNDPSYEFVSLADNKAELKESQENGVKESGSKDRGSKESGSKESGSKDRGHPPESN